MKLTHERTIDTGLYSSSSNTQQSCFMVNGEIVVYGSKTGSLAEDYAFHMCDKQGNPTGQTIDKFCACNPMWINLTSVTINNNEELCVSCHQCKMLRLINFDNPGTNPVVRLVTGRWKVKTAYSGLDVWCMCTGGHNTLFTVDDHSGTISVFDTSSTNFTLRGKLRKFGMRLVNDMCYVSGHDLLVLNDGGRLYAMKISGGEKVWDKSAETIDNKVCKPMGLVYQPENNVLFMGDQENKRIIIVAAANGETVQTVDLEGVDGRIDKLNMRHEQLVVSHRYHGSVDNPVNLSFYMVSYHIYAKWSSKLIIKLRQYHIT